MKKKALRTFLTVTICGALGMSLMTGCSGNSDLQAQVDSLQAEVDTLNNNLNIVIQDMLTLENQIVEMQGGKEAGQSSGEKKEDTEAKEDQKDTGDKDKKEDTNGDSKQESDKDKELKDTSDDSLKDGKFASAHGALSVQNGQLTDAGGNSIQLYGVSTHGLSWFPDYVNKDSFKTLRDDWGANCVRLAMYTAEYAGYCTGGDKNNLKKLVTSGVDAATELGMYVIIDWHVLNDNDPTVYQSEAISFFDEMSKKYADNTNVIYEICNEPCGGCTWDSVYNYANEVIPVIRANDEDAIVIVGTPNWSQQIDKASAKPLDFDNVLYALHFYAATHQQDLRNTLDSYEKNGLPVFVSEFGMCDASGNGGNDLKQAQQWIDLMDQLEVSYMSWNLSNKNETSALISSSCSKTSGWSESELSESGKWIRNLYRTKSGY